MDADTKRAQIEQMATEAARAARLPVETMRSAIYGLAVAGYRVVRDTPTKEPSA